MGAEVRGEHHEAMTRNALGKLSWRPRRYGPPPGNCDRNVAAVDRELDDAAQLSDRVGAGPARLAIEAERLA